MGWPAPTVSSSVAFMTGVNTFGLRFLPQAWLRLRQSQGALLFPARLQALLKICPTPEDQISLAIPGRDCPFAQRVGSMGVGAQQAPGLSDRSGALIGAIIPSAEPLSPVWTGLCRFTGVRPGAIRGSQQCWTQMKPKMPSLNPRGAGGRRNGWPKPPG